MAKRFLFYISGFPKPLVLSDPFENRSIKELNEFVTEIMTSCKFCEFSTSTDSIIVKPQDIVAVYITECNSNGKEISLQSNKELDFSNIDLHLDSPPVIHSKQEQNIEQISNEIDIPEEVLGVFEDAPKQQKVIGKTPSGYSYPDDNPEPPQYMLDGIPVISKNSNSNLNSTRKKNGEGSTKIHSSRPIIRESNR